MLANWGTEVLMARYGKGPLTRLAYHSARTKTEENTNLRVQKMHTIPSNYLIYKDLQTNPSSAPQTVYAVEIASFSTKFKALERVQTRLLCALLRRFSPLYDFSLNTKRTRLGIYPKTPIGQMARPCSAPRSRSRSSHQLQASARWKAQTRNDRDRPWLREDNSDARRRRAWPPLLARASRFGPRRT